MVITRTTRNRLSGKTLRGFESHHLRHFWLKRSIFKRFSLFSLSFCTAYSSCRNRSLRCFSCTGKTVRKTGARTGNAENLYNTRLFRRFCGNTFPKTVLHLPFLWFFPRFSVLLSADIPFMNIVLPLFRLVIFGDRQSILHGACRRDF